MGDRPSINQPEGTGDRRHSRGRFLLVSLVVIGALMLTSCTSGDEDKADSGSSSTSKPSASTTAPVDRPAGPVADLSEELSGGAGVMTASASSGPNLGDHGYVEEEFVAAGEASSYRSNGALPVDGRFELEEADSAEFRTRVLVRRPDEPDAFNGTVVVEWMNVSGGFDAHPDYSYMADELLRGGYVWVGVSAQHIGIEGGPVAVTVEAGEGLAGKGLRKLDPERYDSLTHPGDAFSYDIFTQVARGLRQGAALEDLEPERLLAVGESQSGFALTTYVNGVQPLAEQFDGFLIHSRGSSTAPLGEPGKGINITDAIFGGEPTVVRDDGRAPVLVLESETDLLSVINYFPARQPDSDRFRLWEAAGTAHADRYLIGPVADQVDCGAPVNDGPQQFLVRAALRRLDTWVRDGTAPPEAPRLEIDDTPAIQRDADGIALGGIRTPLVDVPVATLSGDPGGGPGTICLLLGSTRPFSEARLKELYPTSEAYLQAFADSADAVIEEGFVLEDDREALLATAQPSVIPAR